MGVEVAIGSAAAISKVVISIGQCFWKNFNFQKKKILFFCMEARVTCKTSV